MNSITIISLLIIIIFVIIGIYIYNNWNAIRLSIVMYMTIGRGIIAPNCTGWHISKFLGIGTGNKLYYDLKKNFKTVYSVKLLGQSTITNIIFDINFIKQVLDNSPTIFGAGKIKYDFFKSFMKFNVGISEGCPWKKRRALNEHVLVTDKPHIYENLFETVIASELSKKLPNNFNEFSDLGKKLVMKFVFNEDEIFEPLFEMINAANSISSVATGQTKIDPILARKYYDYLNKHVDNPNENCLMYLTKHQTIISNQELIHQIPHWIFPIMGIVTVHFPRFLAILTNHSNVMNKIVETNYDPSYLRKCVLELFRLNNAVNSTFRTLLKDYQFDDNHKFKKGDQFLILNGPVLRDPQVFKYPHKFIPDRWNSDLEDSYYAIMFNQGPQRCPAKELSVFILTHLVSNYIKFSRAKGVSIRTNKLNTNYISEAINPCPIIFKQNIMNK